MSLGERLAGQPAIDVEDPQAQTRAITVARRRVSLRGRSRVRTMQRDNHRIWLSVAYRPECRGQSTMYSTPPSTSWNQTCE
jgi:hypothetical protein